MFNYIIFAGIILRITNAIRTKVTQYKEWLKNGVVNKNQPFIVAINAGLIERSNLYIDYSYGARACFALGPQVISIPIPLKNTPMPKEKAKSYTQHMPEVIKVGKTDEKIPINTNIFLVEDNSFISGIIFSDSYIGNVLHDPGSDIELIINPFAKNPIDEKLFHSFKITKAQIDTDNATYSVKTFPKKTT